MIYWSCEYNYVVANYKIKHKNKNTDEKNILDPINFNRTGLL